MASPNGELPNSLALRLPLPVRQEIRLEPLPEELAEAYKQGVRLTFGELKRIADRHELQAKSIALVEGEGRLVPVCELHARDEATIAMLAEWRRLNMSVHPTQFAVTLEGTADWLRSKVLDDEGRILFLVSGPDGEPVGHYGLMDAVNDECEAFVSSGMRGVPRLYPGIVGRARATVVRWATEELGARRILAVVFADNQIALRRLKGAGFRGLRVLPLRRRKIGGRIEYRYQDREDPDPPDRFHVLMAFEPLRPKIPR